MHTTEKDFPGSESIDSRDSSETSDDHSPYASGMTATYSPEDNKLRLYSVSRLDAETYAKVKAEGFRWAPQQKLFVAPMWTPSRADLLIELCGEIGDEDTSLVDRAEERAERFEDYSDKRAKDADAAHASVERITSGIPLGQPILVGHHSERHARKDAERIENGMKKAVKMWETSKYWVQRAAGAIRHAKYKERPDVRHRRIKGLEADKRKQEKAIKSAEDYTKLWAKEGLTREQAIQIANFDHIRLAATPEKPYGDSLWDALDNDRMTVADAIERAIKLHAANSAYHRRWLAHIENRLAYERAMLGETGGIAVIANKFQIEVGGRVLCGGWRRRHGYLVVLRVNKKNNAIVSVRTKGEGVVSVEEIEDYKAPEGDDAEKVKKATALSPLVNYPGEGFRHMTKVEFDKFKKRSSSRIIKVKASDKHERHRLREAPKEGGDYWQLVGVYLTDAKRVDPPAPVAASVEPVIFEHVPAPPSEPRPMRQPAERTKFDDMKDSLKSGVTVVSAPQLFPTPPELAVRMVELADIEPGMCVLEPSAGTGNIVRAILDSIDTEVLAYEINANLCTQLGRMFPSFKLQVRCRDFLTVEDFVGCYPRVLMNPPFANGQDVEHVNHAWKMLAPDGVLVAIMSAGVKFRSDKKTVAFRALVDEHGELEDLPEDTFKEQGTGVRTVLVTLRK